MSSPGGDGGLGGGAVVDGALGGLGNTGVLGVTGLDPSRPRGFGAVNTRVETPSLNDMRAKQKAIVAKFMTFFQGKSTLVFEMYEHAFYSQKPNWDKIAEFIYSDLCKTQELRSAVKDVQFHPVKKLLFMKFSEERWRDAVMNRVQSPGGVKWSGYGVKVKGYSLDAQVKFIRVLGVSPETEEDEIRGTFQELGLGEVVEIKKGLLDDVRLPGVTN